MENFLFTYLLIINFVAVIVMAYDKRNARAAKRRVPERNIFMIAIFGGALGILAGMKWFRHKTLHWQFAYGIPFILLLQIVVVYFIIQ